MTDAFIQRGSARGDRGLDGIGLEPTPREATPRQPARRQDASSSRLHRTVRWGTPLTLLVLLWGVWGRDKTLAPAKQDGPGRQQDKREEAPRPRLHWAVRWGAPLVLLVLLLWGAWGHYQTYAAARETQRQTIDFVPTVHVGIAKRESGPTKITLPGQTQAFDFATIYARATGYIAERRVDIGSRVYKGDLLVRISAPDLDAQLLQAEAQLGQARAAMVQAQAQLAQSKANVALAHVTNARTSALAGQGYASKQDADNARANVAVQSANVSAAEAAVQVSEANIQAQQATVDRLRELTGYERVTAPFDGVITARNVDVGDLVNADQGNGAAMFNIMQDDVLRIAVQMPQSDAIPVHDGLEAGLTVPEIPGGTFYGQVARSSVALSDTTRTLLVQVDVPNPDHVLRPGLYVSVAFAIPRSHPTVVVPDEALIFNASGEHVAVVQPNDTVKIQKVSISRDFGTDAELRDGLRGGEKLVLNAPVDLADGGKVKVAPDKPQKQQPGLQASNTR